LIKLVSVNAFNLYGSTDPDQQARFRHVEEMIRRLDADIIAVQEIIARPPADAADPDKRTLAERHVRQLADAVDRRCDIDGDVVFALGGGIHHTALLWREGNQPGTVRIRPVAGKVNRFERDPAGLWHSLVTCVFEIGAARKRLRVGSVQLSPFDPGQGWGWRDAAQVMRAMNSDDVPGLNGGDWNGLGATTVDLDGGGVADYDPDPYAGVDWHPDHAYQLDEHGHVDRSVALRLEGPGRFRDCARITNSPWRATTGHPADRHPPRRIDRWYATHHLPDAAVTGYGVAGPDAFACTDHLPVWITLDVDQLPD
jgi:hypothetical protein